MELKIDRNSREETAVYPTFRTVEEMIGYARRTVPEERIMLQRAEGDSLTVGAYLDNLNKVCAMLRGLGVKKGSTIGAYLPNCEEYVYLYGAAGRLGAVLVPLNQFLKGETLSYVLNHCEIEFLVTNKPLFEEKIAPVAPGLTAVKTVLFVDEEVPVGPLERGVFFGDYRKYADKFVPDGSIEGSTPYVIWLTSGTTGLPKGVVATQEYLLQRACFSANYFRIRETDVVYFILPMYHIPFFVWGFPFTLMAGCTLVYLDWFSASKFWDHAAKYGATMVYSTGTVIPILLKKEVGESERAGKDSVRLWGAWPLDQPDVVYKRWPNAKFVEGYGLSEYALATITTHEKPEDAVSQGPATPFTEMKICDQETGEELSPGTPGEIVLRSRLGAGFMMDGYYKSPKETDETIRDGWLYTGDMGYLDGENRLHFVDRLKDSVRVGGENVPSVQLEALISAHPKILEAAVVGAKGELGHNEIVAHVVLKDGEKLGADEFFAFCSENMPYFMVPKYLRIRPDLPKTATYKVQKFVLREDGLKETFTRGKIK